MKLTASAGNAGSLGLRKKVLIVDDKAEFRESISLVINHQSDLIVCGQAENSTQALALLDATHPDVVLVDITLGSESGIDLIQDIKARSSQVAVVVLTMHEESRYGESARQAGAQAYVRKHEGIQVLLTAIRRALIQP